ncbi:hypothetical protein PoMZ_02206 [Pyricularia oryzae]|uniref:Uncharacterized protein n=1 Tax=Pyricularia oryzae TaxID=318829 RepID=A0A4P7N6R8_PYROR|nr:hypothetical protein PoMZ_02206 [Pyricularia oryzae]
MHDKTCPKCGAASDGSSKTCGSCGAVSHRRNLFIAAYALERRQKKTHKSPCWLNALLSSIPQELTSFFQRTDQITCVL